MDSLFEAENSNHSSSSSIEFGDSGTDSTPNVAQSPNSSSGDDDTNNDEDGSDVCSLRNEMPAMMYGMGDDMNPFEETIDVLLEIVKEYISDVTLAACQACSRTGRSEVRLSVDSIKYVVRKSPPKVKRIDQLLELKQVIRSVRSVITEDPETDLLVDLYSKNDVEAERAV